MTFKSKLPIIDVTNDNFAKLFPSITYAVKEASFISLDLELTGLGDRKKLNNPQVDERYLFTVKVVKEYAIISIGMSCFMLTSVNDIVTGEGKGKNRRSHNYVVQNYNFLMLPTHPFTLEPGAAKFLCNHGVDFNKIFANGIPYHKSNESGKLESEPSVKLLFDMIIQSEKPVVFHNGFLDLAFLYQSFYANMPKNIDSFAADLSDIFMNGIYDTKYFAEFLQKNPATFLEYLFKTMQLKNCERETQGHWHIYLSFPPYPSNVSGINYLDYASIFSFNEELDNEVEICEQYANHGWCPEDNCTNSHNVNRMVHRHNSQNPKRRKKYVKTKSIECASSIIIAKEIQKLKKKTLNNKKLEQKNALIEVATSPELRENLPSAKITSSEGSLNQETPIKNGNNGSIRRNDESMFELSDEECYDYLVSKDEEVSIKPDSPTSEDEKQNHSLSPITGGHTAGYDAFMTAYLFACFISQFGSMKNKPESFSTQELGLESHQNKIYLCGKSNPFLIRKGNYAKYSKEHLNKKQNLGINLPAV